MKELFEKSLIDIQTSFKKNDPQSDDEYTPNHIGHINADDQFIENQEFSQKVCSSHRKQYMAVFNLKEDYKFDLPQITQDALKSMRKNGIRYIKEYFNQRPKIKFIKSSPSYSVIDLQILIGNFNITLKLLNIDEEFINNDDANDQEIQADARGNYGQIRFIDWEQFLNSKYAIQIDELKKNENQLQQEQAQKAKNQFATKLYYFPQKGSIFKENIQYTYDKIYEFIIQYAICKVASCFKIGLSTEHPFGFDFVCYRNCIQFFMQKGQNIPSHFQQIQVAMNELKRKLFLLHSLHIVHRDIKYENLIYSPTYNAIVFIDFGLSEFIKQNIGEKTKSIYKGSYYFLSQEVKKLMFEQYNFYVDLYWNDVVGLIKTKGMLKKMMQNSFQIEIEDNIKNQLQYQDQLKAKRISFMFTYLRIKIFESLWLKKVELPKRVIQKMEKSLKSKWIQKTFQFLRQLESCPRYDQFLKFLLKQSVKKQIYGFAKDKSYSKTSTTKQFLKRYEYCPASIDLHMTLSDDIWKRPLQMLCKQIAINRSKQVQFSILTYSISLMFRNVDKTGYIFKKLLTTFPEKILKHLKDQFNQKFVFRNLAAQDEREEMRCSQQIERQQQQSQKHIIVDDYLIEINKSSAVLMTRYIENQLFTYFKINKNSSESCRQDLQFQDPNMQKHFLIQKQVEQYYLVSQKKITKIILMIFKVYVKQSSHHEAQRLLRKVIKKFCSKRCYLRHLLQIVNIQLYRLSIRKYNRLMNEVQTIHEEIKQEQQKITKQYPDKQNTSMREKYQELKGIQYEIYITKLNYDILTNISLSNAFEIKQKLTNEVAPLVLSTKYQTENIVFRKRQLDVINLQILCNNLLGKQLNNTQLLQQYYQIMNSLSIQRNILRDFDICNLFIKEKIILEPDAKLRKCQNNTLPDSTSLLIDFQENNSIQNFNFNSFIYGILKTCNADDEKIKLRIQQSIIQLNDIPKREDQIQNQYLIRINAYYVDYLRFCLKYKFTSIKQNIKQIIFSNFKVICQMDNESKQIENIKFKSLQNTIHLFLCVPPQNQMDAILELHQLFVGTVQKSFINERDYPEIYWVSKCLLLKKLYFNQGQKRDPFRPSTEQIARLKQQYYFKLVEYNPMTTNYLSFLLICDYLKLKLDTNQKLNQISQNLVFQFVNIILNEELTQSLIKSPYLTLTILRYMIKQDKLTQFMRILALICRQFYRKKNQLNKVFFIIVKVVCDPAFYNYTKQTLEKINIIINRLVWSEDDEMNVELCQISYFWILLIYKTKSMISEQILMKITLLLDYTSLWTKNEIFMFYYEMVAQYLCNQGKLNMAKKLLKYDIRHSSTSKKELYLKLFLKDYEYQYLTQNLNQCKKNSKSLHNYVSLFKRKIIDKVIRLKQNNQ